MTAIEAVTVRVTVTVRMAATGDGGDASPGRDTFHPHH